METQNQITVISVTYSDLEGLAKTAASLKEQIESFTWIVIDGGTTNFHEHLKEISFQPALAISEKDNGIYDAMNKGLNHTSTEYVLFLNSGDRLFSKDSIQRATQLLKEKPDFLMLSAAFETNGKLIRIKHPKYSPIRIKHSVPANQQATIYRTEVIRRIGGMDQGFKLCSDYAVAAKLHMIKAKARCSYLVFSRFELGGRSTTNISQVCKEAFDIQRQVLGLPLWQSVTSYCIRIISMYRTLLFFRFSR